jgi:hypothetical protein
MTRLGMNALTKTVYNGKAIYLVCIIINSFFKDQASRATERISVAPLHS